MLIRRVEDAYHTDRFALLLMQARDGAVAVLAVQDDGEIRSPVVVLDEDGLTQLRAVLDELDEHRAAGG